MLPGDRPCHGQEETQTIEIRLELLTGGSLVGRVVDHDEDGIVVVNGRTPYVFAWAEVETGSAYRARRDLLALEGDAPPAAGYFQLGLFALSRNRGDLAQKAFSQARRLDPTCATRIKTAFDAYRRNRQATRHAKKDEIPATIAEPPPSESDEEEISAALFRQLATSDAAADPGQRSEDYRTRVAEIYEGFGRSVREHVYRGLVRIESPHFLIFTDWPKSEHERLLGWVEAMYHALCRRFGRDPNEPLFLAKCPVFCWQSAARFAAFARAYDGYETANTVGYTRSIAESGHVHMAILRQGTDPAAMERFAGTLVHEGTHAFLHRLYSSRLIAHWVNEGIAGLTAEEILQDHYFAAEKAALLARQYIRYEWPITDLVSGTGPIALHEYPLALSVVEYLDQHRAGGLAGLIKALKDGQSVEHALENVFGIKGFSELQEGWRSWIQDTDPYFRRRPPDWEHE